jgi:hypothetical protein
MIAPPSFEEAPELGEALLSATLKSVPALVLEIHAGAYEKAEALASARRALFESFRLHGVEERQAIKWTVAVTAEIRCQLANSRALMDTLAEPAVGISQIISTVSIADLKPSMDSTPPRAQPLTSAVAGTVAIGAARARRLSR